MELNIESDECAGN